MYEFYVSLNTHLEEKKYLNIFVDKDNRQGRRQRRYIF